MILLRIKIDGLSLLRSFNTKREFYREEEQRLVEAEIDRIRKKHPTYLFTTEKVFRPEFHSLKEMKDWHNKNHLNTSLAKCKEWECARYKRKMEKRLSESNKEQSSNEQVALSKT